MAFPLLRFVKPKLLQSDREPPRDELHGSFKLGTQACHKLFTGDQRNDTGVDLRISTSGQRVPRCIANSILVEAGHNSVAEPRTIAGRKAENFFSENIDW